jgi:predicted translin family RNA/ssDNA-binding protein
LEGSFKVLEEVIGEMRRQGVQKAAPGNFKVLEEVIGEMRRQGVQKAAPGCSWVEVGSRTVEVEW